MSTPLLAAYELTGSYRAAAELAGWDHKTVKHYVDRRDAGLAPDARVQRDVLMEPYRDKLAELVERSKARIRADRVHDVLVAMGYDGLDRTTRREVAEAKRRWRAGHRRVFKPWIPEPGMWLQYDWGEGPPDRGAAHVVVVRVAGVTISYLRPARGSRLIATATAVSSSSRQAVCRCEVV